jgi:hypothetical protein
MKNPVIILGFCVLLFAAGCGKGSENSPKVNSNSDCANAEYPFACFLDKATAAKDPNLCDAVGSKRITCITAYEELLEVEVPCDSLQEPSFAQECSQYKANLKSQITNPVAPTETILPSEVDSVYMND